MDDNELKQFIEKFDVEKFKGLDDYTLKKIGNLMISQGHLLLNLFEVRYQKERFEFEVEERQKVQ